MTKNVFISYHFSNRDRQGQLEFWLLEAGYKPDAVYEKDLNGESEQAGKRKLQEKLDKAEYVIFLVGQDAHNSPWIRFEVSEARKRGLQVFWIQLPNTSGAVPPEARNLRQLRYEKDEIIWALRH